MIKLTPAHVTAVEHAEYYVSPLLNRFLDVKIKRSIERDLKCLDELKSYIRDQLSRPELPYGTES